MRLGPKDSPRQDLTGSLAGDKVRIKTGSHAGERGVLQIAADGTLAVKLDSGKMISALGEELTNFSLAARRAWEVMPKRAGRPISAGPQKRMVSIRIDSEVWELLGEAVELGRIRSRESAINAWLREKADKVLRREAD